MADTVTGFTAARMQEIEDAAIVSAAVVVDDLIMTRFDTSTFNAGNVRGPVGPMNPDGNPAGTIIMGGWAVEPVGYLFHNQTVIGGVATYPDLAAIYPSWVSGGNLVIPDFTNAVPMCSGGASGVVSGTNTKALTMANIPSHAHSGPSHAHSGPSHAHSINSHGHTAGAGTDPGHDHTTPTIGAATMSYMLRGSAFIGSSGNLFRFYSDVNGNMQAMWITDPDRSVTADGGHGHTITVANSGTLGTNNAGTGDTGNAGTGNTGTAGQVSPTAVDVTQRNFSVKFAVKT